MHLLVKYLVIDLIYPSLFNILSIYKEIQIEWNMTEIIFILLPNVTKLNDLSLLLFVSSVQCLIIPHHSNVKSPILWPWWVNFRVTYKYSLTFFLLCLSTGQLRNFLIASFVYRYSLFSIIPLWNLIIVQITRIHRKCVRKINCLWFQIKELR